METLETHIGLSPEEMITIFNRMYMDVWEKMRDKIDWKKKEAHELIVEVMEVVVTAMRDGAMLALYENNERIYQDLVETGILPERKSPRGSEE